MGRDESCIRIGSVCQLFFASVLHGVVSPRFPVSGTEFAFAAPCLSNIAICAYAPAQVRVPCRYARVLPRRDGVRQTKGGTQFADIFHGESFAWYHCHGGGTAAGEELCACSMGRNLQVWLDVSTQHAMARLFFLAAGCGPDFAAGFQSHVGATVLSLCPVPVREPGGLARVLPRRDGICKLGQDLGLLPYNFCRAMWLLQC